MRRTLLPEDENNKDGNAYLFCDRGGWKRKKKYLGISTKGMKLGFARHAWKERGKRKGLQANLKKKSYIFYCDFIRLSTKIYFAVIIKCCETWRYTKEF